MSGLIDLGFKLLEYDNGDLRVFQGENFHNSGQQSALSCQQKTESSIYELNADSWRLFALFIKLPQRLK
ncbi:MAG: hypothetical protein C4538_02620 [Nitrospiraceae bacterium]|nr:MAG: hypothetical protein C4538_02620 [Nitrospiraceae bacterium]